MTEAELIAEFEEKQFDSTLGRLIQKIIIVDPITKMYANGELRRITLTFNSGRTVNVSPEDVTTLADQPTEAVVAALDPPPKGE